MSLVSIETRNEKATDQNQQLEDKIQQIIDELEDDYIQESHLTQGKEFLYSIQDQNIRQDSRILNIEARLIKYEDVVGSQTLIQSIFQKNPLFFKNTFEYLIILSDSSDEKSYEVLIQVQNLLKSQSDKNINHDDDDAYYLACKSLTLRSNINMNISRQVLEQAIQKAKKPYQKADMYAQLGNTYLDLEEFKSAINCYKKGLRFQPKNDECLSSISGSYFGLNKLEKAIFYGEQSLLNNNNNFTMLGNLACFYLELNQIDKAENAYTIAMRCKSVSSYQYSSYAKFLFFYRLEDKLKTNQIFQNLKQGFLLDPTRQNPIFETLYVIMNSTELFSKMIYSYQPIQNYIDFIESVRLVAPSLLLRILVKVFINLKQICISDEDNDDNDDDDDIGDYEEHLQTSDQSQDEINNQNENQLQIFQNQQAESWQQQINKSDQQKVDLNSNRVKKINQNEIKQQEELQPLQPYKDPSYKQPITTHQKVQIYKLIHDLIKLKIQENQTINTLLAYHKHVSNNLHFRNAMQFWDLYFD